MGKFDYIIEHRKGAKHRNSDFMSRISGTDGAEIMCETRLLREELLSNNSSSTQCDDTTEQYSIGHGEVCNEKLTEYSLSTASVRQDNYKMCTQNKQE